MFERKGTRPLGFRRHSRGSAILPAMSQPALALLLTLMLKAAPSDSRPVPTLAELPPPATPDVPAAWSAHRAALAELGEGFVVWESNRSGSFRLWTMRLDGTGLRQLTPDEPGRAHVAPHISPDGKRLAYLAIEAPHRNFGARRGMFGELRVVSLAKPDAPPRVAASGARPYHQNRAAVWASSDELIFIARDGSSRMVDLRTGEEVSLTEPSARNFGLLVNASLTHATSGSPTFSIYRAEDGAVARRKSLPGCQPYFTHDGRHGYWVSGSGGPFRRIDLASRKPGVILEKHSEYLPEGHGYVYYPMVSRGGNAIVFGSSRNEHGHFDSDYDIFVAPLDRKRLVVNGTAVRLTFDPAQDRFPDIHLASEAGVEAPKAKPLPEVGPVEAAAARRAELAEDRVFSWENANSENLVLDPKTGLETSVEVEPRGLARVDSQGRMRVNGGSFAAELPGALLASPRGFAIELLVDTRRNQQRDAHIASFGVDGSLPFVSLTHEGPRLEVHLETEAGHQTIDLGKLGKRRPQHLLVEVVGDQVRAFRKGQPWRDATLIAPIAKAPEKMELWLGADADGTHDWHGTIEGVGVFSRALSEEEIDTAARSALRRVASRRPPKQYRVRARLKDVSEPPTLAQIEPYREALVLHEYKVLKGKLAGQTVRVAHWAILDGENVDVQSRVGAKEKLVLEEWEKNPQVESTFVSDTLDPSFDVPIYLDVTS